MRFSKKYLKTKTRKTLEPNNIYLGRGPGRIGATLGLAGGRGRGGYVRVEEGR